MVLQATRDMLSNMVKSNLFDSYALYVRTADTTAELYSNGIDENTFFDIASMGKVLVTAPLILRAVSELRLSLQDTLDMFFDDVPQDKKKITVEQLLLHTSGIVRYDFISKVLASKGKAAVAKEILSHPTAFLPGTGYSYSCEGYILLGFIAEKLYGLPLDKAYRKWIQEPLGLDGCVFNLSCDVKNRVISYYTEKEPDCLVADMSCNAMNGVAGNGCSFWTMSSLKKFADAVMCKDERLYAKRFFDIAEQDYTPHVSEGRGLGWLITDERYKQTGKLFSKGSFGHCGNTGTSFFFDRKQNISVILLTNATRYSYMRRHYLTCEYNETMQMREMVHTAILFDLENNKQA